MEVKDYSSRLDSAREKFREAQNDLKQSYDKSSADMKENFDYKIKKQAENYSNQKTKLEEENAVNNEMYSNKTKDEIAKRQDNFKEAIKKNTEKFASDRDSIKNNFDKKLDDISESFRKSSNEKDRYHTEAKKTLEDRYKRATANNQKAYESDLNDLESRATKTIEDQKLSNNSKRKDLAESYQKSVDEMRDSSREEKFKEVSRLRNDNRNLRENFLEERQVADDQREARIADIMKAKNMESAESQKNFSELQDNIRKKNLSEQERIKEEHIADTKAMGKKFSDDMKNVQRISNQKIQNGTEVESLKDQNKKIRESYENRIAGLKQAQDSELLSSRLKAEFNDQNSQENIKNLKLTQAENIDAKEKESVDQLNKMRQDLRDRNSAIVDRYKAENSNVKRLGEEKLSQSQVDAKKELTKQRVEFGKVVNTLNEKNVETVSTLKNDFAKDKTEFIEKAKRDFSEEKNQMRDEFNRVIELRDSIYEKKLAEKDDQAQKIIDNYEMRLEQLARKNDKEVETLRITETERKNKEDQANRIARESDMKEHMGEIQNLRDKYERIIARDKVLGEQNLTKIVQKYEDQLERERFEHQRDLQSKLAESQASFERLFKSSELEKSTMRKQYEDRIEMMKLAESERDNSKKA